MVTQSICTAQDFSTTQFGERVKRAQKVADQVKIDGRLDDWGSYPGRYAATGAIDASRDLVSTRLLADAAGLRVCVTTRGVPSRDAYAFGLRIDFEDTEGTDLELSDTEASGCKSITHLAKGRPPLRRRIDGVQVGIGECVEWFIPWESIAQALPGIDRVRIVGDRTRAWVRVMPYTWDSRTRVMTDYGAAAACFRLPLQLESAKTGASDTGAEIELPVMVEGQTYIVCGAHQGANGVGDHRTKTCYDLTAMDSTHSPSSIRDSRENEPYYAFGRKIFSPLSGTLLDARDSIPDHASHTETISVSNFASLKSGADIVWFVHNKQHSLVQTKGAPVAAGDVLARIGNTGPSGWPHVHIQAQRGPDQNNLVPIALKNVRVCLNSGTNDYWARDLDKWRIQEGFFIESTTPFPTSRTQ